jgi:hypothetical protein
MRQMHMKRTGTHNRASQLGKLALVAVAVPVATRVVRGMSHRMQQRRAHARAVEILNER